jgi:hypothetical protein
MKGTDNDHDQNTMNRKARNINSREITGSIIVTEKLR